MHRLTTACSLAKWTKICRKAVADAIAGDAIARRWISDYLLGKPVQRVEVSEAQEELRIAGPDGRANWARRIIEMGERALQEEEPRIRRRGNGDTADTPPARVTPTSVEEMLRYSEEAATEAAAEIQANTPSGSGDNEPRPSDMEENDAHENSGFDATGNGYRWRLRAGDEPN